MLNLMSSSSLRAVAVQGQQTNVSSNSGIRLSHPSTSNDNNFVPTSLINVGIQSSSTLVPGIFEGDTAVRQTLPRLKRDREAFKFYNYIAEVVYWDGKNICCCHKLKKSLCTQCGGSAVCEHGKQKFFCRECFAIGAGGGAYCQHGTLKSYCRHCGGSAICEHSKQRSNCITCGGTSICVHKIQKYNCKVCGTKGICEHGKQRSICKDCKGSGICEHLKQRAFCRQCKGSGFCIHSREKHLCRDCHGRGICVHNRRRSDCKPCGGSSICPHGRQKHRCRDCGGKGVCDHGRRRTRCRDCLALSAATTRVHSAGIESQPSLVNPCSLSVPAIITGTNPVINSVSLIQPTQVQLSAPVISFPEPVLHSMPMARAISYPFPTSSSDSASILRS